MDDLHMFWLNQNMWMMIPLQKAVQVARFSALNYRDYEENVEWTARRKNISCMRALYSH